jgi:hypothetical protein
LELKSFEELLDKHDWFYFEGEREQYEVGLKQRHVIDDALRQMWLIDPLQAEEASALMAQYIQKNARRA